MAPVIRGTENKLGVKKTSSVAQAASGGAYQDLNFYTEGFQPGESLVDDDEIGGARTNLVDPVQPARGLPNASGGLTVPLDRNQLPFWLAGLWGPPTSVQDAGGGGAPWTHTFVSGGTAPQLYIGELPVGSTPDFYKLVDAFCLSQMTLDLADQDGFRKATLETIQRSVRYSASALRASTTAAPARDKVTGGVGTIKINSTLFGNVIGGQLVMANGAFSERYFDDSEYMGALEIGTPSVRLNPQIRVRTGFSSLAGLFDGVTPFSCEIAYQATADKLVKFTMPKCVATPVMPNTTGKGAMEVTPSIQAFQDGSNAMLTTVVRNLIASY